jgi:hypothetical protein
LVRIPKALLVTPVVLTLGLALGGPTAVADPPVPPGSKASAVGQAHRSAQAEQTLATVEELVHGDPGNRGHAPDGRDLTVALRDLSIQLDALSPADRHVAERYLLRPGSGGDPYITSPLPFSKCSADICIHWTEANNADAPNGSDGSEATVPPFVGSTLNTMQQVHDDYLAAGYREEKGDGTIGGGTNKTDVYIGDIGPQVYGFCSEDDPNNPNTSGDYSTWGYCALDDDFAVSQFPTNTPIENMQVTAAHEYFHAVQFAYDRYEDSWILESTATWAEDEMFDAVDDNRNYLSQSPLAKPWISLDYFGQNYQYGTWIWWRYLTEKFPTQTGKLPRLVLDLWKRLDGTPDAPDAYSSQAMAQVLSNRGTSLRNELQRFYAANRHPGTVYEEGGAYRPSPAQVFGIGAGRPNPGVFGARFDHMSSQTLRFNPKRLAKPDWKLRLAFNAPPPAQGGAFAVIVYKRSGGLSTSLVRLNRRGDAVKTFPFSSGAVRGIDVVFVNTSARFTCFVPPYDSPYSCYGTPKDDNRRFEVDPKAFRA